MVFSSRQGNDGEEGHRYGNSYEDDRGEADDSVRNDAVRQGAARELHGGDGSATGDAAAGGGVLLYCQLPLAYGTGGRRKGAGVLSESRSRLSGPGSGSGKMHLFSAVRCAAGD